MTLALRSAAGNARLGVAVEPSRSAGVLGVDGTARVLRPDAGSSLRSFHRSILPQYAKGSAVQRRVWLGWTGQVCGKGSFDHQHQSEATCVVMQ